VGAGVPLPASIDSTDLQRKVAAGQGQLAQGTVAPLKVSEWARLYLHAEVTAIKDRDERLGLSLLMAGHPDSTKDKVCLRSDPNADLCVGFVI
jgi:hypothetical protein